MKELSLHILDIAQNAVNAKASRIEISILDKKKSNELIIEVKDNGCGMNAEMLKKVNDPFFTTGQKKTGLGIPLLKQHTEATGGEVRIGSIEGSGTWIHAQFTNDHIDRQPMGNLSSTLLSLIRSYTKIDWVFNYESDRNKFKLDTREVKEQLADLEINHPQVIAFLKEMIEENLNDLINEK